jgi:hypothetical protein
LNQSSVAYSIASKLRHGPRLWITLVAYHQSIANPTAAAQQARTTSTLIVGVERRTRSVEDAKPQ